MTAMFRMFALRVVRSEQQRVRHHGRRYAGKCHALLVHLRAQLIDGELRSAHTTCKHTGRTSARARRKRRRRPKYVVHERAATNATSANTRARKAVPSPWCPPLSYLRQALQKHTRRARATTQPAARAAGQGGRCADTAPAQGGRRHAHAASTARQTSPLWVMPRRVTRRSERSTARKARGVVARQQLCQHAHGVRVQASQQLWTAPTLSLPRRCVSAAAAVCTLRPAARLRVQRRPLSRW